MFAGYPLIWANLTRRKLRLVFTFDLDHAGVPHVRHARCVAHQPVAGRQPRRRRSPDRAQSKVIIIDSVPACRTTKRCTRRRGVAAVVHLNWFGGVYKDGKQQIRCPMTDPEEFMKVYPEVKIKPEEFAAWKADRQGIVVGQVLADQLWLEVGHRIPLRSSILRKTDGTATPGSSTSSASTRWRTARAGTTAARCFSTTTSTNRCSSART